MTRSIDPFARREFESIAQMTLVLLDQVLAGKMSPVEFATWLRQLMMRKENPLSDNEKSAITCTLALMLLSEEGLEFDPSRLMEMLDSSDQALAIGRLV